MPVAGHMHGEDDTLSAPEDRKYWYAPMAFVLATLLSVLYVGVTTGMLGGNVDARLVVILILLGLTVLGVVSYPALFFDMAYIRRRGGTWRPKSWYYVAVGFGIPFLVVIAGAFRYQPGVGLLLGIVVFLLVTFALCSNYLYRRHSYLEVP